jgi:predicted transcriptional regulator of viral defense system
MATRQHGFVSHRQHAAVGIRGSAVTRWLATGRLERVYPGVFAVGHVPRTREARWMAAVMACGQGAALSHLDAAALWRIYESRGNTIHVTTTTRSPRRLTGIRAHRARRLDPADVTVKDGIPVTTVRARSST